MRVIMYTPAVTIVAAWINALTGVGPSMASGSQTYSGICADFPVAPTKSSSAMAVIAPLPTAKLPAGDRRADLREPKRAQRAQQQKQAEEEARVTDAVDDERLLPRVRRRLAQEVEPDQQVAAQAHAFPSDEQQQQIVRQDQRQHREHEQIQVAEEAVVAALVRHVAGGINVNQEADAGDHAAASRQDSGSSSMPHCALKFTKWPGVGVHRAGGHPVEQHDLDHALRHRPRNQLHDRAERVDTSTGTRCPRRSR